MPTTCSYYVVDAFANRPFSGNPAAVVLLDSWPPAEWLQRVAMEMNLSETAYLVPSADGYDLRWFTPKMEVDLCGHATLASATVLAEVGKLADGGAARFSTRSGVLVANRRGDRFELDFPLTAEQAASAPAELIDALGVTPVYVGRSRFDWLIDIDEEKTLRSLAPDFRRLAPIDCRGVSVTAKSDVPQFDFVSRFFAPAAGIDEDPVTGSAHCCLADYWGKRLGKTKMIGYQASARGGAVNVEVRGERVILGGNAVIAAAGELRV
jgi:PhzF family phenazine biosynthesis protein